MEKNKLESYILDNIESERWEIGYKLPSEKILIKKFNLSKSTVRKVIQKLANNEVLFTLQGKGVFVSKFWKVKKELPLGEELKSDKVIYLPTSYKIPKEIYEYAPFFIPNLNKNNSFQFIKIYFSDKEVQAYSIDWMINENNHYVNEMNDYIYGKRTLFADKAFKKVFRVHKFLRTTSFDNKLLRINIKNIPTIFAYFINEKNEILMVRVYKINPKFYQNEQVKIIL